MAYLPSKPVHIKIIPHSERPMKFENGKQGIDAKNLQIGIIQHGTLKGQTTLGLCMETEAGENVLFEITANQFEMLIGAFNGAQFRFQQISKSN